MPACSCTSRGCLDPRRAHQRRRPGLAPGVLGDPGGDAADGHDHPRLHGLSRRGRALRPAAASCTTAASWPTRAPAEIRAGFANLEEAMIDAHPARRTRSSPHDAFERMTPSSSNDLEKRFGGFTAVDRISFSVRTGEIFGFLGPQRRRQVHDHPHALRHHHAHLAAAARSPATTSCASPSAGQAGHRLHVPEVLPLRGPDARSRTSASTSGIYSVPASQWAERIDWVLGDDPASRRCATG
ncbi:MAG: hypothetical protein MZV70_50145 [Desulfobacterales bacterium]|nr:hypothetical protein [Desulfobacterales bacterium]